MEFIDACNAAYKLLLEDDFKGFYLINETPNMWVFYGGNPNEPFYGLRTVFVDKATKKCNWFDIHHRKDELKDAIEVKIPKEFLYSR